ncbi:MAG TPA: lysylphosphatidylglycerol synthase transmembrane domain-containing protein [Polyangiaceae bacterium]|nr:lysylphosphatidylglycerol synthase transmembrane domain-containing protein [Polyangiaceae bacterium]
MTGTPAPRRPSAWLVILGKLAVTGAALAWAFSRTSVDAMLSAVRALSPGAGALAVGLGVLNLAVGALRFRDVLAAYGLSPLPPFAFLFHGYLVASFYNTFVPGNVGGDALRAHTARAAFGSPADAYVAVILERGLGVSALFVVSGLAAFGTRGVPSFAPPLLLGTGVVLTALSFGGPAILERLARFLPRRFAAALDGLTVPRPSAPLLRSFLWSVATQILSVLAAHVLLSDLAPEVTLRDSLALVPLAMLSIYVPVSLLGLGLREAAFVVLFGRIGVPANVATAGSLAFMASLMTIAALGGIAHALKPLELPATGARS